jgi:starch synthase
MPGVMVAHPDIQHSLQLAVALQDAGLLQAYITRLYTSWDHPPFSFIKWLPRRYRANVERLLFERVRRSHPDLNPDKVHVLDTINLLTLIALKRTGLLSSNAWYQQLHRTSISFQKSVGELARQEADVLVCYDRLAFDAFKYLSGSKVKLVLDLSIAHPITARRILEKEKVLSPEFASSLEIAAVTEQKFVDTAQESAMADYILVGSNFVRDSCLENGIVCNKIFVVPYGTDVNHFRRIPSQSDEQNFRVLFVGQIGQRKGIRYLLEAFTKLKLPNAELWLCGNIMGNDDALRPYQNNYKYLGYVPHPQMPELYNQVDVFVLPTLLEGLSQVGLEAMACGRPVITTPNSGLQGILRENEDGFIVPIRDVDALAEKILFLYKNRDICKQMGKSARQTAETCTWQRYREQIATVFRKILAE